MKRREFLKASAAATSLLGLGTSVSNAAPDSARHSEREYYELRAYRLPAGASHEHLDVYFEKAAVPALNRLGISPVGAFTEINPTDSNIFYVLLTYPTLDSFARVSDRLNADADYLRAAADYLNSPKSNPQFERIDSWLLMAFSGMPKIELPAYSREKKPRMFEMRTYESFSEIKALKKIEMFNSGEIETMRQVGLAPVFYGQALVGPNLPHLTYMTSAENEESHKKHWDSFGKHPVWLKLKNDPQYADTVSKITKRFLKPTAYSQI
jgi:hypothetical protein